MTLDQLTQFFKWMTIINAGLFILNSILAIVLKKLSEKCMANFLGLMKPTFLSFHMGTLAPIESLYSSLTLFLTFRF